MSEQFIQIQSLPTIIDLEDEAFQDAGSSRGNSKVFLNKLNSILSGSLLDEEAFTSKTPEQKRLLEEEIQTLNEKMIEGQHQIVELKETVDINKRKIEEFRMSLDRYKMDGINGASVHLSIFSPIRFGINSFFLLMLSVFIFLFYVAVVYKGLVMDGSEIAQQLIDGDWGINILPNGREVAHAMQSYPMVIFAPFVFFGFGYVAHLLLGTESKMRYLWTALVLIITFVLDFFIAARIHKQMNDAYDLMGLTPNDKFSDIFIVLILGFVVYIIWSVIFHFWMLELDKRNIPDRLGRLIKNTEKENRNLQSQINILKKEIELCQNQILQKKHVLEIKSIPLSAITKSLSTYIHGWYRYVTNLKNETLRNKLLSDCEKVLSAFKKSNRLDGIQITMDE